MDNTFMKAVKSNVVDEQKKRVSEIRAKQMNEAQSEIAYMKVMTDLQELKARYQRARLMELEAMIQYAQIKGEIKSEKNESSTEDKQDSEVNK